MPLLERTSPVTGEITWSGLPSSSDDVRAKWNACREAFVSWRRASFEVRCDYLRKYASRLEANRGAIARTITLESGKPIWESQSEVSSSIAKVELAIQAYSQRRSPSVVDTFASSEIERARSNPSPAVHSAISYAPLGTVLVLGPFNLPLHLPGAHFVPALLSGNTVLLKPSEKTPAVGEWILKCWREADLPAGVLEGIQGDSSVAREALASEALAGVFFTGSLAAGTSIHRSLAGRPEVLVALEMGGNNPLVVERVENVTAAVETILQSAYLTSGQRCTCARRLVLIDNASNRRLLELLCEVIPRIRVSHPLVEPPPFLGTLVDPGAARRCIDVQSEYQSLGMYSLVEAKSVNPFGTQLTPGLLLDETAGQRDEEVFGPLLTVRWVRDLDEAIDVANASRFALSASLLSDSYSAWQSFHAEIRAGIVNWNQPTTGATGKLPFGGLAMSGNHRSSGYFACDYCSDPVASLSTSVLRTSDTSVPGLDALWNP